MCIALRQGGHTLEDSDSLYFEAKHLFRCTRGWYSDNPTCQYDTAGDNTILQLSLLLSRRHRSMKCDSIVDNVGG